jgi:wyosine [tRNA(Phe)-imidazoG37] synthetase (radical SAM superfamily)
MHVGASQERLERDNMPFHEYILEFSKKVSKFLPEYEIVSEHIPSRVVLLVKKSLKINDEWNTWIDFKKFHELFKKYSEDNSKNFSTEDYLKKTPKNLLGIRSEKETSDEILDDDKKEYLRVCEQGNEDELE